jgi:hypothetical protein
MWAGPRAGTSVARRAGWKAGGSVAKKAVQWERPWADAWAAGLDVRKAVWSVVDLAVNSAAARAVSWAEKSAVLLAAVSAVSWAAWRAASLEHPTAAATVAWMAVQWAAQKAALSDPMSAGRKVVN